MPQAPFFDILGLGVTAVDDVLYVDEYPPAEAKVRVRRRMRQLGGLTGTAVLAAARLGGRCAYAGRLGDDDLSRFMRDRFTCEGIDLAFCPVYGNACPAHSTIVIDGRRHTRTIFASLDGDVGPPPEGLTEDLIARAKTLLIDHHGLEGTLKAVRAARVLAVPVVADFERNPGPPFDELLTLVDHIVVSSRFARELTGADDPALSAAGLASADTATHTLPRTAVVTCGREGAWCAGEGISPPQHVPAFRVNVVDSNGCGDVFHGAYALALAEGRPLMERVRFAAAAAALRAEHEGSDAGCRPRHEVDALLAATSAR
ncbi:MAG: PfkB family carbohydrate kinase [Planctomycetota bacterium]